MNKQKQRSSPILNRTNRQFYMKRLKTTEQTDSINIGKILKSLIKRNEQHHHTEIRKEHRFTQNRSQATIISNDKIYELTQLKRTLSINLKKINNTYTKLFKSFQKCINAQTIQQAQFHQLDFLHNLNSIITIQLQKTRTIRITNQNYLKLNANKQNALFLENRKLQKQNRLLRQQITTNQNISIDTQLFDLQQNIQIIQKPQKTIKKIQKVDFINNELTLQRKFEIQHQQNQIMKRQILTYKQQIFLIRQQKKSLKQRLSQLKTKNQTLCSEIIALQLNNKKHGISQDKKQSIMTMQSEQIQSYRRQLAEMKKLYLNLNKKYKTLIIKFKKGTSENDNKIGIMYNKQSELFPQQAQAFREIRERMHNSGRINISQYGKDRKLDKSVIYQQFFGNKQTMNNKQGIKKAYSPSLQYYNPTFYSLIAQDISFFGIDQTNLQHFNQSIKLNFIATIRAIMDSKFNQFILKKQNQSCSSFPSFVLAWLTTFYINSKKKIQKLVNNTISTKQTICIFYTNLMSQKLNYSWQILAFRQFLLETLTNDELFYYLNVRRLLIGSDITRDLSYSFQQIYYIDFTKTYQLLGRIIKQSDRQARQLFEQFMKKSIVYIRKKSYLDLHQVLRVLLQYYQNQKQRQIEKINKTIQMVTQNRNSGLNLGDFQKIFDYHFGFLTQTEIIQLYRRTFCIGNGTVTPQTIITVLTQQNIFLRWIQPLTTNDPIKIDQLQNVDWDINYIITPNLNWLYSNQEKYRFMYNTQMRRQADSLGIEELEREIKRVHKLDSFTIIERMELIFEVCMMFTRKFYYSTLITNQTLKPIIELTASYLHNLSKATIGRNQIHQLMKDLKYQTAGGRIVRFYCRKKEQMMRSILYSYASNEVVKEDNDQKTEMLRAEFMQLIAKSKQSLMSKNSLDLSQEK